MITSEEKLATVKTTGRRKDYAGAISAPRHVIIIASIFMPAVSIFFRFNTAIRWMTKVYFNNSRYNLRYVCNVVFKEITGAKF